MIEIGIVDDSEIIRVGISHTLTKSGEISIIIEADNGRDFLDKLLYSEKKPTVILLDILMPEMNGREVMAVLTNEYPNIKVIVLSAIYHEDAIIELFNLGARGYLKKGCPVDVMIEAIRSVEQNETVLFEEGDTFRKFSLTPLQRKKKGLTEKELDFIKLCADGSLSYKEMAARLDLSLNTVHRHREDLFRKLGLKSRTSLAIYAIQTGLIMV